MKKNRRSEKKLLIRLCAVLLVLVAISRVSAADEHSLVGVRASAFWEEIDTTSWFSGRESRESGEVTPLQPIADNTDVTEDELYIDVSQIAVEGDIQGSAGLFEDGEYVEAPDPEKDIFNPYPTPEPEREDMPDPDTLVEAGEATPTPTVITPTPTPAYGETLAVTDPRFFDAPALMNAEKTAGYTLDERYTLLTGSGTDTYTLAHKAAGYENEQAALAHMVTIEVPVWEVKSTGKKAASFMKITVNSELTDNIRCIFSDIFLLPEKFPIKEVEAFAYRKVSGAGLSSFTLMSAHSFGAALEINPGDYDNDLYLGKGNDLRDKKGTYYISQKVIEVFEHYGWYWGGKADAVTATAHFTYLGLDGLKYKGEAPYPVLSATAKDMKPEYIINLTSRLYDLGYLSTVGVTFTDDVTNALKAFQKANKLKQSGKTDVDTWIRLINLTHYMSYAF